MFSLQILLVECQIPFGHIQISVPHSSLKSEDVTTVPNPEPISFVPFM